MEKEERKGEKRQNHRFASYSFFDAAAGDREMLWGRRTEEEEDGMRDAGKRKEAPFPSSILLLLLLMPGRLKKKREKNVH